MNQIADKIPYLIWFLSDVRQPYDACKIVLCSLSGLWQDRLADLQECQKCGHASIVCTSLVVLWFVAFLRQPCNKAKVIA